MKILKIFGIVAGIHAFALILIFTNPGCSSTSKPAAAPEEATPAAAAPAPVISVPLSAAPTPVDNGAAAAAAPAAPAGDTGAPALTLFSPTRPGTLAAAALVQPAVTDVTPASTYVVARGDSLWSIAKKNHVKISELVRVNGLHSGSSLHLGQRLIIPGATPGQGAAAPSRETAPADAFGAPAGAAAAPAKYVVRRGESLGAIARKFHVRMRDLAVANNISDPQDIHAGQELTIPGGHLAAAKAEAPAGPPAAPPLGADQDLDAGLKPVAPGDALTIKSDDAPAPVPSPQP